MRTLLLTGVFAVCAAAQTPTEPPALIQLIRQPGLQVGIARPYSDIRAQLTVLAMTAMTGSPESWLLETHDNFASIEALDAALAPVIQNQLEALDGQSRFQMEVVAAPKTVIATYRPNLSYLASDAVKQLPKAHYYLVSIFRIRPGTEAEFIEGIHRRRAANDAARMERPQLAYHVLSGAPAGTYLFITPLVSLKTLDDSLARSPEQPAKSASESEISREHFLLRVEPRQSYVSDEFAEADLGFWRGIKKEE